MMRTRRGMAMAIALSTSIGLMIADGGVAGAQVQSSGYVSTDGGKPRPDKRSVETTTWGIAIHARAQRTERRTAQRRGRDDVDRAVDRVRRGERLVAQRVLTEHERALEQARRRAACLATLQRATRAYARGIGLKLSADRCRILDDPAQPSEPDVVVITEAMVLTEVKNVGFASSVVHVQPRDRTLVNLDTNFYADPKTFDRAIPVLGQQIPVRANPTYTWHFGAGTTVTTKTAGAPYPDGDISHRYTNRGKVVVSVTLNYATYFKLPGNDWQYAGVVDIPGPGTALTVCEARPVLTDPDNPDPYEPPADASNSCTA